MYFNKIQNIINNGNGSYFIIVIQNIQNTLLDMYALDWGDNGELCSALCCHILGNRNLHHLFHSDIGVKGSGGSFLNNLYHTEKEIYQDK